MAMTLREIASLNTQVDDSIEKFHACSKANLHAWHRVQELQETGSSEFLMTLEKAEMQMNECSQLKMETDELLDTATRNFFEYWKSGRNMVELAEALYPDSLENQVKFMREFFNFLDRVLDPVIPTSSFDLLEEELLVTDMEPSTSSKRNSFKIDQIEDNRVILIKA